MTVYICGAGPTGLSLAWLLRNRGQDIVIVEKYHSAGGTWAARWKGGLFTQHSPQILSTSYLNTFKIWNDMGLDRSDFLIPYKAEWMRLVIDNTTFKDKIILVTLFLSYMFISDYKKTTVEQELKHKLSPKAWKMMERICYLVDGVSPEIMTVGELYSLLDNTVFYKPLEMSKPSDQGFAKELVDKLGEYDNISFKFNTELKKIFVDSEGSLIGDFTGMGKVKGDIILAVDPLSLLKILSNSDDIVQNNWGNWNKVFKHIQKGIYVSISVQYHFDKDVKIPYSTKTGMTTEWGIICVELPFTKTISCSVINLNSYSSFLEKRVRDCNPEEIKREVWRQLSNSVKLPEFSSVTIGTESKWDGKKWGFDISSAARTIEGHLDSKGRRKDLSIVGPINYRSYPATTMEAAVESALRYTDGFVLKPVTLSMVIRLIFIFIIVLTVIYYLSSNKCLKKY